MGEGKSNNLSAFGKPKWRSYRRGGQEVPADLGGMSVFINESKFEHLEEVCEAAQLGKPSDGHQSGAPQESEMKFFRELLQSPVTEAGNIMEEHLDISQNDCDNDLSSKFDMRIGMYVSCGNSPEEEAEHDDGPDQTNIPRVLPSAVIQASGSAPPGLRVAGSTLRCKAH